MKRRSVRLNRLTVVKYLPLLPVCVAYAILLLLGVCVPGMWQMVALVLFFAAVGQAFNIFIGMTGYVDFGYVAFMALGTYGMALAISRLAQFPQLGIGIIVIGLVLATVMAVLLSIAVGGVALRLRGAYFAIATIGVSEGFRYFIDGAKIWGGSKGIIFSGQLRQVFGPAANSLSTFWADVIVLLIAVTAAVVTLHYMRSRIGYALTALREDEDAAKVMGINVTKYKIMAFVTSAAFAGLIGASAWALKMTYVFPRDVFLITYTVEAIVIVMLGGAGTLLGPVVGALIYGLAKYWLAIALPGYQLLIFAPALIIIILVFPEGVVGVLKRRARGTRLEKYVL